MYKLIFIFNILILISCNSKITNEKTTTVNKIPKWEQDSLKLYAIIMNTKVDMEKLIELVSMADDSTKSDSIRDYSTEKVIDNFDFKSNVLLSDTYKEKRHTSGTRTDVYGTMKPSSLLYGILRPRQKEFLTSGNINAKLREYDGSYTDGYIILQLDNIYPYQKENIIYNYSLQLNTYRAGKFPITTEFYCLLPPELDDFISKWVRKEPIQKWDDRGLSEE